MHMEMYVHISGGLHVFVTHGLCLGLVDLSLLGLLNHYTQNSVFVKVGLLLDVDKTS